MTLPYRKQTYLFLRHTSQLRDVFVSKVRYCAAMHIFHACYLNTVPLNLFSEEGGRLRYVSGGYRLAVRQGCSEQGHDKRDNLLMIFRLGM
jgi:hypothetical protein